MLKATWPGLMWAGKRDVFDGAIGVLDVKRRTPAADAGCNTTRPQRLVDMATSVAASTLKLKCPLASPCTVAVARSVPSPNRMVKTKRGNELVGRLIELKAIHLAGCSPP